MIDLADFSLNYGIGDTVTMLDTKSPLFKRDCVVVHVDRLIVGVISDGITEISFVPYESLSLKLVKKGEGFLTNAIKARVTEIMKGWGYADFIGRLPSVVEKYKKRTGVTNADDRVYIKLDGFVPKEVATAFKKFEALMDLAKATNPNTPAYIHKLFLEWILMGAMASLSFMVTFKEMMDEEDSNGKK